MPEMQDGSQNNSPVTRQNQQVADVYEDRIAICKSCVFYFKPTGTCKDCGCFMKIKARLAPMGCGQKKWQKTTKIETPDDLPQQVQSTSSTDLSQPFSSIMRVVI